MKFDLKITLIIVYVLVGFNTYLDRIMDLNFSLSAFFYVVLLFLCLSGIVFTSLIKNFLLRVIFGVIFFSASLFTTSYEYISSSSLTYNAYISLINASGFAGEAFMQYFPSIAISFLISLLLFVAIILTPNYKLRISDKYYPILPVGVILILTLIFFVRGGDGGKGLPAPYISLPYSLLALYESSNNMIGERKEVTLIRKNKDIDHDIILIIDESILPSYFDINSSYGVTTNLKNTRDNINIFNYGYASSISNCSSEVNVTLRFGGTRDNYLTINSTMPSIWKYAQKANLRTVYIDAQRTGMTLQNEMTDLETQAIDEFVQFDDIPVMNRDLKAADKIIDLINNDSHEFIIVNKIGGHFPINDKYPDQYMKYKPSLPRGMFVNISDSGSREGFSGQSDAWMMYRNSYRNTILWGVGHFFEEILNNANLNNAVIIYTSDHGQDLHEDGRPGVGTHCSSSPVMEEGMVPLVVIKGSKLNTLDWNFNFKNNKNSTSHYNIFPTILSLMLYEAEEVDAVYGKSLHQLTNDEMTFNSLFHARLGKKPIWKKIEPDNIFIPIECKNVKNKNIKTTCSQN